MRDRVTQAALRNVLEPILERQFAEHSYGFHPNRGCKDALRRVDLLVKKGFQYTVDVDLKSYFDTIPHERLLSELRKYVADNRVIDLVAKFLKAEILDGQEHWEPESGVPHGAAKRIDRILCETMEELTGSVPVACEFALADRWYKAAEAVFDAKGQLQRWKPQN